VAVLHHDGGAGAADRSLSWESIPVPFPEEKGNIEEKNGQILL